MIHDPLYLHTQNYYQTLIPPIPIPTGPDPGSLPSEPRLEPCTKGRGRRGDFSVDKRRAGVCGALVQG